MKLLIFGATGSIGNHLFNKFNILDNTVYGTTTKLENIKDNIILVDNTNYVNLLELPNLDAIIWAHGYNFSDNINNFDVSKFNTIMDTNVSFILNTLNYLLNNNKINNNAKMVIISSIWEESTRPNKLSYTISKAALSGLVKNIAYDLSTKNILINNVLPGVIDNNMSRAFLSENTMNYVKDYLNFGRLITLDDVYNTVKFLVSENTGITGQSIKVDLGFTNIKDMK
jgi:NAD(P)-dependent dehydrogenase (short-subunit alcohol dehydrogenase family)